MAEQLDIYGGSTPLRGTRAPAGADPHLAARLGRRQENRERIEGTTATWQRTFGNREKGPGYDAEAEFNPHTGSMADYGVRDVKKDVVYNKVENKVPYGPHDAPVFRKAGEVREVPLVGPDAVTTMQSSVSPARVSEIARAPQSASDPRFRGTPAQELPLVVEHMTRHPETKKWGVSNVLYNGNHTVAAAIEQGQMFTPAHVIPRESREASIDVHRRDSRRFKKAREEKEGVASTRMALQDATIKKGYGGSVWSAIT